MIKVDSEQMSQPLHHQTLFSLTNFQEDYFKKPAVLTNDERLQELRRQMEEKANQFKPLSESINKKDMTKDLLKVDPEPIKALIKVEQKAAQSNPCSGKIRVIDGVQYVVHDVKANDSLMKLGLVYNVPAKMIKQINGLQSDQIFQLKELLIPVTSHTKVNVELEQKTAEQILADKMQQEIWRREAAVHVLNMHMLARMPNRKIAQDKETYRSEAIFYCEQHDFNVERAKAAFEADYQFE